MTDHIAIYGKGGAGKTTLAANLAAALAEAGKRILLIGCDPKSDTGTLVHGAHSVPTLLEHLSAGKTPDLPDIMVAGYRGIACIEVGDAIAEEECASRRVGNALELLAELRIVQRLDPDCVLYDMPGTIGCSGIARHVFASNRQRNLIVATGDLMSFYAANSFIRHMAGQTGATNVSIVGNRLAGSFEESFVTDFARRVNVRVAALVPRSLVLRHSELYGKTVIESAPHSGHAQAYRKLARQIIEEEPALPGAPAHHLSPSELRSWAREWGDRLGELEFGILKDGAGI